MLIEFAIHEPFAYWFVRSEIKTWADQYPGIQYQEKTVKKTHRLCFEDDSLYSLFMLSWTHWDQFPPKLIQERNRQ